MWKTLYDIGAPHSVVWDDLFIIVICAFIGICLIVKVQTILEDKKKLSLTSTIYIVFLSLLIVIGICSIAFKWIDFQVKDYNPFDKFYNEGDLIIADGIVENVNWGGGGFFFSVDNVNFLCNEYRTIKREINIEPYFNEGQQVKIYYYGGEYQEAEDELKRYTALRIDVLTDEPLN